MSKISDADERITLVDPRSVLAEQGLTVYPFECATPKEDDSGDSDEDAVTAATKRAARRTQAAEDHQSDDDSDDDDSGDDEDSLADDETTAKWLDDVTKVPEIQKIIKGAATELAKSDAVASTVAEVRKMIEEDLDDRLDEIRDEVKKGKLTPAQAKKKAKAAASAAADTVADEEADDEEDPKDKKAERQRQRELERDERREARLRFRELETHRKELLAEEDSSKLVVSLVTIEDGDEEEDIEAKLELARKEYKKVRRQVVNDLRAQGWKSPKELRGSDNDPTDDEDEDDDPTSRSTSPPSRDRRGSNGEMSKRRQNELRDRFRYADPVK